MNSVRSLVKPITKLRAKQFRNNPTVGEYLMWQLLKRKQMGYKFRRQSVLFGYIADFYCPSLRLIIEVDGLSHSNHKEKDNLRDKHLKEHGIKTMRIDNRTVLNEPLKTIKLIRQELQNADTNR